MKGAGDGLYNYYLYDGDQLLAELNPDGSIANGYLWGPTGLNMRFSDAFEFDPQGNCVGVDGGDGHNETSLFDAYGVPLAIQPGSNGYTGQPLVAPGIFDPIGYKGQFGCYTDLDTGLVYCQSRYYDPYAGRWITKDPIGAEGGVNVYEYCDNNPVVGADPSGLQGGSGFSDWFFSTTFGQLFVGDNWENGLYESGSAGLHVASLGHYTNPTAEAMPGYGGSEFCWTVAREALLWAAGEGVVARGAALASKGFEAIRALRASRLAYRSIRLGQEGESAVRAAFAIGAKSPFLFKGTLRIADGLNWAAKTVSEVRNVKYLSATKQIQDYVGFARANGLRFDLYVRAGTKLSDPLEDLVRGGAVNLRRILK